MGVLRLIGTLLKHPATKSALYENVPVIECLMIDYNANIHYILQKIIMEFNEILYFTFHRDKNIKNMLSPSMLGINDYYLNLEINMEDLEDKLERYHEEYQIGMTYEEISKNLSSEEKIINIIFNETINYTRQLICSLNKGFIKKVYLALDGVPSMAKIREQRNRRYIGSYLNNIKEDIIRKFKMQNDNIYQINLFYFRSVICAGSNFMDKIQQALFNLDINLDVDVSTINTKGEGEKKIIHALKQYSNYSSYCIMSPDSDMLILIGLLCNDIEFRDKKLYNFRIDYANKNKYQFFDLQQLVENFRKYYSEKIGKDIANHKMLDMLFMLTVFGNDFLPKIEPLDITQHFDLVCESCLKLSMNGLQFIVDDKLNYQYLLEFFRIINKDILYLCIEQLLTSKYNNYQKLCKLISLGKNDLEQSFIHPELREININCYNFYSYINILNTSYNKLISYLKNNIVDKENIKNFYREIQQTKNDSYLLLVLPRLLKFPGADPKLDPYSFFKSLIIYTNSITNFEDFKNIKFRTRLMPRIYNSKHSEGSTTAYLAEMEKLNKSQEPYYGMFKMAPINLVNFDITTGSIIDLREKYYQTYIKPNITQKEIENLALDYLVGIEWLYQYYITGKHMEWSGWQYNHTQPPLVDDIIKYLENHPNCGNSLDTILSSYPENNLSPKELYLYVTPNDYTKADISPNISDVVHLIDGYGAIFLNKCQIRWHDLVPHHRME